MNDRPAAATVEVLVNGERRLLEPETRVSDLVEGAWGRGVAVARNGDVVPRAEWSTTALRPGDEIEIVHPIQGG